MQRHQADGFELAGKMISASVGTLSRHASLPGAALIASVRADAQVAIAGAN
jgi:hypothetical protein